MRTTMNPFASPALAALLFGSAAAHAGVGAITGNAVIDEAFPNFDGADHPAFDGASSGQAVSFRFEFDTGIEAVEDDGISARYEFVGGLAQIVINGTAIDFDSFTVHVRSSDARAGGALRVQARSDAFGLDGDISILTDDFSTSALSAVGDLGIVGFSEFFVNSDENQLLLPIVFGSLSDASVVPVPSSSLVLLGGIPLAARRRRSA